MITNEKEYAAAKSSLARFQRALSDFDIVREIELGVDPKIARAQKESFAFQVDQLSDEIRRYEMLKGGLRTSIEFSGVEGIGPALIQARVARGLSQKRLAEMVGIQEQQVQRYEKDFYRSASLKRLGQIAHALGARLEGVVDPGAAQTENSPLIYGIPIDEFPFAEAKRAQWFGPQLPKGRVGEDEKKNLLWRFFAEAPAISGQVLHRKTGGSVSLKRQAAVVMWQAQVLRLAESVCYSYPRFHPLDSSALKKFVRLSVNEESFEEAHEILKDHGIILICQKHLKNTKLDGAALALRGKHAVLALTLRHNRLDNLWFNLLHELGHLTRHWDKVLNSGIVDEDIGLESTELFEREADEFARNAIVPDDAWSNSMVRYANEPEAIRKFAKRFEVHPALIAGRVRHERGYSNFSELVGRGIPRRLMARLGLWSEEDELV